ncbi:putative MET22-protein ser/thr phosphatase [Gautieria morchelliformis]|nr:putative MET22-protein ser/thr phosphatase [Gautieria morchelliformis]
MSVAYALEKQVAISAVLRACNLASSVFNKLVKNETVTKDDKSPVTVADYSAQALINTMLCHAFPEDPIVGEEDTATFRGSAAASPATQLLRERISSLANEALQEELATGDQESWGIGPQAPRRSTEELLDAIDRGSHPGGPKGRMWTLDPIDGTKGFLRGEQYAVCLALIVDSQVQVGVIGCPNLPYDWSGNTEEKGVIFVAVKGQGAEQRTLTGKTPMPLKIPSSIPRRLLESYESGHSSHGLSDRVSKILGITQAPLRLDSQVKYGALARGDGMAYFRMPTGVGYKEKIWDHAPGNLIVTEAGGLVTDSRGQPLNFGLGRTLGENHGVIGAGKEVHASILEAVQKAQGESKAKA